MKPVEMHVDIIIRHGGYDEIKLMAGQEDNEEMLMNEFSICVPEGHRLAPGDCVELIIKKKRS